MTTANTAYQFRAYQFGAYQEGAALGSGDVAPWLRLALLRGRKRKPEPVTVDEEEREDAEEITTMARAPLRFRARAPVPAIASLGPLLAMAKARDEAEFKALVDAIMASDDFYDA